MGGRAVAEPGIELGRVFKLLPTGSRDDKEFRFDIGEGGEVTPEFFELGDGEDVFLSVAPAFFDFLEGDVGREAGGNFANGFGDDCGVSGEDVFAGESKEGEELVEVDPGRHGVVVGEDEFVFFPRHGKAFEKARASVDGGEAASSVFEAAGDDFEGEASFALEVVAQEGGVNIGTEGVDVMKHEGFELRTLFEKGGESSVQQEVGQLEEVADGVEALKGEVVGVVRSFPGTLGPADESGAEGVAHFLLLGVENLLGHFFPGEAEIALGGNHAEADGATGRKVERAGVLVVIDGVEEVAGGAVGEVGGGEEVGDGRAGFAAPFAGFSEVGLDEGAVFSSEAGEGVEGLADARALGPSGAGSGREGDDGDFSGGEGLLAEYENLRTW